MTDKHTPGPWKLESAGTGEMLIAGGRSPDPITRARYLFIATVSPAPSREKLSADQMLWDWLTPEESRANAHLIAAAPELAEAADAYLEAVSNADSASECWVEAETLRAVLKKAGVT